MAKFVSFKGSTESINLDHVISIYESISASDKPTLILRKIGGMNAVLEFSNEKSRAYALKEILKHGDGVTIDPDYEENEMAFTHNSVDAIQ